MLKFDPIEHIHRMMAVLKREAEKLRVPVVGLIAEKTRDPFCVLISCLLSLRTRDETTAAASERLFRVANTPQAMLALESEEIQKAIYPVAFYRNKSKSILEICRRLIEQFGGQVPDSMEALLSLHGVGRKTANLVVTVAYKKPGICVDTHVHRISNRIGLIQTRTPDESEMALRSILPRRYWISFNDWLVPYGQFICTPISPFCSRCQITDFCKKTGVGKQR